MSEQQLSGVNRLAGRYGAGAPSGGCAPEDQPTRSPMNCKEVRSSASDYVDGETAESLTDVIKRHLGLCRDCDGWVKSFAITVGLLKQVPQEEVPESLRQKIRKIPGADQ